MPYFNLHPDFDTLCKYYSFDETKDEFHAKHPHGYTIELYWFDDQKVASVIENVKELLATHDLQEHYDNIMVICLTGLHQMMTIIDDRYDESQRQEALQQLAKGLLFYNNNQGKQVDISFKTVNDTVKISNQKLALLLGKLLRQAVEQKQYPLNDLPYDTFNKLCDMENGEPKLSKDKLQLASDHKAEDSTFIVREFITKLCILELMPYLHGETHLKRNPNATFTDIQLEFIHPLLVATTFLQERHFNSEMDYDPKDFMRNYLVKHINKTRKRETKSL